MAEDHDLREILADTPTAERQERTFLGGIGFSKRTVLLALAGLAWMVAAAGVYYLAAQKPSRGSARDLQKSGYPV